MKKVNYNGNEITMNDDEILVRVCEFHGGRYGQSGISVRVVRPEFFKNGQMKKSRFTTVRDIETIKHGYGYGNASYYEWIAEVIE